MRRSLSLSRITPSLGYVGRLIAFSHEMTPLLAVLCLVFLIVICKRKPVLPHKIEANFVALLCRSAFFLTGEARLCRLFYDKLFPGHDAALCSNRWPSSFTVEVGQDVWWRNFSRD
jgi:hypothetical protein